MIKMEGAHGRYEKVYGEVHRKSYYEPRVGSETLVRIGPNLLKHI
jgi:hypothetical protein